MARLLCSLLLVLSCHVRTCRGTKSAGSVFCANTRKVTQSRKNPTNSLTRENEGTCRVTKSTNHSVRRTSSDKFVGFTLDLGYQGLAFQLNNRELAVLEKTVLDFLICTNSDEEVTIDCVTVVNQASITTQQTISEFENNKVPQPVAAPVAPQPDRRLGEIAGDGSTGTTVMIDARCHRCASPRLVDDTVNQISNNETMHESKNLKGSLGCVCPNDLLGSLRFQLPHLFQNITRVVAEEPEDDSDLESILHCLNNHLTATEEKEPPVGCDDYVLELSCGRIEKFLPFNDKNQCRRCPETPQMSGCW